MQLVWVFQRVYSALHELVRVIWRFANFPTFDILHDFPFLLQINFFTTHVLAIRLSLQKYRHSITHPTILELLSIAFLVGFRNRIESIHYESSGSKPYLPSLWSTSRESPTNIDLRKPRKKAMLAKYGFEKTSASSVAVAFELRAR